MSFNFLPDVTTNNSIRSHLRNEIVPQKKTIQDAHTICLLTKTGQCVHYTLLSSIILTNIFILAIIILELTSFTQIFHSFKSDIRADVKNFNEFLHIIPELKGVLNIISNLCNIEAVHPYCNNQTSFI